MLRNYWSVLSVTAVLGVGQPALAAAPAAVVVCYSGGSVNQADANAAMGSMLRVVERVGQWQKNQFTSTFTAKAEECSTLMAEEHPEFAIIPLGLYLDRRAANHWVPLVQPKIKGRTAERYRVVVRKGSYSSLDALKGHSLGGTVLGDPAFIARIVFAGKIDLAGFELKPSELAIRTLRSLDRGELDAVLLNEQQFDALDSLGLNNPLEVIFTSEEIPLLGVVANSEVSTPEEQVRFTKALASMCADAEGKKLCDLFGVESFLAVDPGVYERVSRLWDRGG